MPCQVTHLFKILHKLVIYLRITPKVFSYMLFLPTVNHWSLILLLANSSLYHYSPQRFPRRSWSEPNILQPRGISLNGCLELPPRTSPLYAMAWSLTFFRSLIQCYISENTLLTTLSIVATTSVLYHVILLYLTSKYLPVSGILYISCLFFYFLSHKTVKSYNSMNIGILFWSLLYSQYMKNTQNKGGN